MTPSDKAELVAIARRALAAAVNNEPHRNPPAPASPALLAQYGCFVTLKTNNRLRGCIGCFSSSDPLYKTVALYTRHSALEDPRFTGNRLKPDELPHVELDISVLTPLAPCSDPENITLGVHGIHVSSGGRSGCFLPQVATETGWSIEEFWGHCCRDKAGLAWDAWRNPGVALSTFTADVIHDIP